MSVMFFSCTKTDDPVPADPRDQILGAYTGTSTILIMGSKVSGGKDTTIVDKAFKFNVEKSGSNIIMDGITGNNVTAASNGATFNIVSYYR